MMAIPTLSFGMEAGNLLRITTCTSTQDPSKTAMGDNHGRQQVQHLQKHKQDMAALNPLILRDSPCQPTCHSQTHTVRSMRRVCTSGGGSC